MVFLRYITFSLLLYFSFSCTRVVTNSVQTIDKSVIEMNQILGSIHDRRPDPIIARDMMSVEPYVQTIEEWEEIGPDLVDLQGWDDSTIPDYLEEIVSTYCNLKQRLQKFICINDNFFSRQKKLPSLIEKLRRWNNKREGLHLYNTTDLIAFRIVTSDIESIQDLSNRIQKEFQTIKIKDYITHPLQDGYRSYHIIMKEGDVIFELQLRTYGMHIWSEWLHDSLYKKSEEVKKKIGAKSLDELNDYAKNASDYIYAIESGKSAVEPVPPKDLNVLWDFADANARRYMLPDGRPNYQLITH